MITSEEVSAIEKITGVERTTNVRYALICRARHVDDVTNAALKIGVERTHFYKFTSGATKRHLEAFKMAGEVSVVLLEAWPDIIRAIEYTLSSPEEAQIVYKDHIPYFRYVGGGEEIPLDELRFDEESGEFTKIEVMR